MSARWDRLTAEEVRARDLARKHEYRRKRGIGPRARGDACNCVEVDYTDEERAFLTAVDRWKVETGTRFPTLTQLLAVLKGLGYRRVID